VGGALNSSLGKGGKKNHVPGGKESEVTGRTIEWGGRKQNFDRRKGPNIGEKVRGPRPTKKTGCGTHYIIKTH